MFNKSLSTIFTKEMAQSIHSIKSLRMTFNHINFDHHFSHKHTPPMGLSCYQDQSAVYDSEENDKNEDGADGIDFSHKHTPL